MDVLPDESQPVPAEWRHSRSSGKRGGILLRVLALLHLLAAIVLTIGVLTSSPAHLTRQSSEVSYGGDAYTGIQNAASETEAAVVSQSNQQMDDMHDVKVILSLIFLGSALVNVAVNGRPISA